VSLSTTWSRTRTTRTSNLPEWVFWAPRAPTELPVARPPSPGAEDGIKRNVALDVDVGLQGRSTPLGSELAKGRTTGPSTPKTDASFSGQSTPRAVQEDVSVAAASATTMAYTGDNESQNTVQHGEVEDPGIEGVAIVTNDANSGNESTRQGNEIPVNKQVSFAQ